MDTWRRLLQRRGGLLLIVALSIALGASLAVNLSGRNVAYAVDQNTVTQQHRAALYELQDAFTSIVDEVVPSVVSITSKRTVDTSDMFPGFGDDMFKNLPIPIPQPNMPQKQQMASYGSGVIVQSDGYILTNDHVVGGADKVTVTLKDGRDFEGTVMRDPKSDLALVKINAKNLPAAKLGDSSKVKVGSWAIAIGSPFGLDQSVTLGVISAIGRQEAVPDGNSARFYPNLIQTDASINPGNSGGPLVNIDGEVVGVNTLIRSEAGGNIGIGFAVPVNTAKFVMDQLMKTGKVTRGFLGVTPDDLSPKDAERYGVKGGILVRSVEIGSPADAADLQVDDVITAVDGKPVKNQIEFRELIASTAPGQDVKLTVMRDKVEKTLTAKLKEAPGAEVASNGEAAKTTLGFSVGEITPQLAEKFKLGTGTKGVVVMDVDPGASAMRAGLQPGQVIVRANDKPVVNVSEFSAATKGLKSGDTLRLRVKTAQQTVLVEFEID